MPEPEKNMGEKNPEVHELEIEEISLAEECEKRAHFDGTWFLPDLSQSTVLDVVAACQLCRSKHNETTLIKGTLRSNSNFKTHLKVGHVILFHCFR